MLKRKAQELSNDNKHLFEQGVESHQAAVEEDKGVEQKACKRQRRGERQALQVKLNLFAKSMQDEVANEQGENNVAALLDIVSIQHENETMANNNSSNYKGLSKYKILRLLNEPCYVKNRHKIVTWLHDVSMDENQKFTTFLTCVEILDSFMAYLFPSFIPLPMYQLAACAALLLASKANELPHSTLTTHLLCEYTLHTYTVLQLVNMEQAMLNTLEWNVSVLSCGNFLIPMVCLSKQLFAKEQKQGHYAQMCNLVTILVTEAVQDVEILEQFPKSVIAAASLYLVRKVLANKNEQAGEIWSIDMQEVCCGYSEDELNECSKVLLGVYNAKKASDAQFVEGS